MPQIDKDTVHELTRLCRIDCTEEEQSQLLIHLQRMLSYIEQLQEVDTANVESCTRVVADDGGLLREDIPGETLKRELLFANAPSTTAGLFRFPTVLNKPNS